MSGGIIEELVKKAPSVDVADENECLQSLRAPSVAVAEARVFSPSGAELEVMHQSKGRYSNGRRDGKHGEEGTGEGWWEGMEGKDGGGDTGKGVGGMVVFIAFDMWFCLVVMASEVMESSGSTWVSFSSLMHRS